MAQLKSEKLMVVPSTADGFRAMVSALRSLDGKDGVSFHTFTLPEDRCARKSRKSRDIYRISRDFYRSDQIIQNSRVLCETLIVYKLFKRYFVSSYKPKADDRNTI